MAVRREVASEKTFITEYNEFCRQRRYDEEDVFNDADITSGARGAEVLFWTASYTLYEHVQSRAPDDP